MKILYVTNDSRMTHDNKFLEKFIEHDHEVHYVSLIRRPIKSMEKLKGIKYYGLPVKNPSHIKKYPFYLYPIRYAQAILLVSKLIRSVKPDLIHGGWIQISGFVSAITGHKPFVLMPFGHDVLEYNNLSYFLRLLTNFTVRSATRIVVDAEFVKSRIVHFTSCNPSKVSVFGWGINRKKFNPDIPSTIRQKLKWQDKKIVLMNRGFLKRYDVLTFINSIPQIVEKVPDFRFLLMGCEPNTDSVSNEKECKARIVELGLSKYVEFVDWLHNDDLPPYLNSADLYVTTSLSDGSSVALMEAVSCGLPMVVTDVPAFREWISHGQNGFIVPFRDSNEVAKRVIQILNNPKLLSEMRKNTLILADKKADWDKNYEVLEEVYNGIV